MSKVHDAMRNLEKTERKETPEYDRGGPSTSLIGALIGELAEEVPDTPQLETVKTDLIAASHSYDSAKKKDLALRFYLAFRSLIRENELLQERLRRAEKRVRGIDVETGESSAPADPVHENEVLHVRAAAAGAGSD